MQVISMVWGILASLGFFVAFIPCLGSLNWLNIPFSGVGLAFSIFAFVTSRAVNRTPSVVGIVLCGIAVLIGAKRLIIGGGIL
jgi:hypothetical protein